MSSPNQQPENGNGMNFGGVWGILALLIIVVFAVFVIKLLVGA